MYAKRVKDSVFVRNFTLLAAGSLISQIISLLVSPLTTRIFTPEEMGIFTFILTAVNLFAPAINLRYDMMIVPEREEEKVYSLIQLSVIICLSFSLVISIGYFFYFEFISTQYANYVYSSVFIFILLFITGINNILLAFNNRTHEYKTITSVYIIKSLFQNIGLVIFGLFNLKVFGMLLSQAIGLVLGFKRQSSILMKNKDKLFDIKLDLIKKVAYKYKNQPILSAPSMFANSFSYSFINIAIQSLYGLSTLGLYSISYRVLGLPLNLVSNNVSKIYYDSASKEYQERNSFQNSTKKAFILLLFMALPMVLLLVFIAPIIFPIVFGSKWIQAGVFVRILAPMYGIRLIASALSVGLQIKNDQMFEMKIQFGQMSVSLMIFFLFKVLNANVESYLASISLCFSLIYLYNIMLIFKISKG